MRRRVFLLVASAYFCASAVIPAAAQHFKAISGNYVHVAAGRTEVWALGAANQVYRFDPTTTAFVQIPGTLKLSQIAVGGGTALQADQVWGLSPAGKVYRFSAKNNAFGQVAGTLTQIVVGEGDYDNCHPYEVWGLDSAQLIYRYDSCTSKFVLIPGALTYIATGGGDVWGLNAGAQIYHYRFGPAEFNQVTGSLQGIAVGVNSDVWGVDAAGHLYRFSVHDEDFEPTIGSNVTQLGAGGHGLWMNVSGAGVTRYDPSTFGFVQVNGSTGSIQAGQIAVGYGAGVWVVSTSHHIYSYVRP